MRTDFREERKWKMAVARNLASACAEWVGATEEDRKLLQVNAKSPPLSTELVNKDIDMTDIASSQAHPTPDLIASVDTDSPIDELDEEPRFILQDTVAPAAIFGLQDDDVVFGLRRTVGTDKLLDELPIYGAPLEISQIAVPNFQFDPDAAWKRPALSLSKYVEGNMQLKSEGPPRKRSRYDYEDEDEDEDEVVFGELNTTQHQLAPESTDVALFNPENKHIRDRIHAGHQFRPPSEFMMPLQSFFECRTASQWTWQEDDDLKKHVRDYSYNWSLISCMLTSKSMFASGAERRTPWECFERWIHLEGLPADMQKTHYFRAYNTRLEMAQRTLAEQAANAPPAQPNAAGQIAPIRRKYTTSIRVERRRNQKHLTLVDAMRKLAKKRETTAQKQQHAAGLAAMRKANEQPQPRAQLHTPQDFSRLKHERELQVQERLARFAAQQEHQRRVSVSIMTLLFQSNTVLGSTGSRFWRKKWSKLTSQPAISPTTANESWSCASKQSKCTANAESNSTWCPRTKPASKCHGTEFDGAAGTHAERPSSSTDAHERRSSSPDARTAGQTSESQPRSRYQSCDSISTHCRTTTPSCSHATTGTATASWPTVSASQLSSKHAKRS